jgi:YebC/PmpR family DNA-binding regulatory protein
MSGHNKWSKIKHKKAATDAVKSRVFSKYSRLITIESRRVGGDTNSPSLLAIIDRAKRESMPKDNIDRAVQKGKDGTGAALMEVIFEGYGPSGTAVIVVAVTDNNNRTFQEIRHIFTKLGFQLGSPGSATWAFAKQDSIYKPNNPIDLSDADGELLAELIEELEDHDDVQDVFTSADEIN